MFFKKNTKFKLKKLLTHQWDRYQYSLGHLCFQYSRWQVPQHSFRHLCFQYSCFQVTQHFSFPRHCHAPLHLFHDALPPHLFHGLIFPFPLTFFFVTSHYFSLNQLFFNHALTENSFCFPCSQNWKHKIQLYLDQVPKKT